MKKKRYSILYFMTFFLVLIILMPSYSSAVSGYKVTYLWHGEALAINNSGQITGFELSQDTENRHAVLWENGIITDIGAQGLGFSEGKDINELGQIVGYYYYNPPLNNRHAFLWENNEMKDLGTLGGIDSRAFGINDLKQVVGVSYALSEFADRPFLWENDQMNDLGLCTNCEAYGINNSEQIILRGPGKESFLWKDGSLTDLGALGGIRNDVHALSNNGQVVGGAQGASFDLHAYIWENSDIKDLGTLGGKHSRALGINEVSEVVGMSFIPSRQHHAFLWKNEQLYDLNDLIQNNDEFDYLEHAFDINDRGQIVVSGRVNGEFPHAFLLTPILTEPVSIDIKPNSCPNPLNLKSKGVLPVAVLGAEDFDVTTIDPLTILLSREGIEEGVSPIRSDYEDVATPFEFDLCDCHDLNGDGYMDLTLKFKTQELVEELELEIHTGETISLTLTGNLREQEFGTPIYAQDCVWILEK